MKRRWHVWGRRRPLLATLTIAGTIDDACVQRSFVALRGLLGSGRPVAGLVLRIASRGGTLAAAQAVIELLQQLRDETGARVVTVVDDMAVSAAYFLSLAGDMCLAQPAAVLGSVGTSITRYDLTPALARWGIQDMSVVSSPGKRAQQSVICAEQFRQTGAGQALVVDIDAQFREWVLARRCLAALPELAQDAATFSGRAARQAGLVDDLGGLPVAVDHIVQDGGLDDYELLSLTGSGGHWLAEQLKQVPVLGWVAPWLLGR